MSNAGLIFEMQIFKFLTARYGFLFLFRKRCDGLFLPSPGKLASLLQASESVAEHVYYSLRQEGIFSLERGALTNPYRLTRPHTFIKYLQAHLITKLGTPKSYSLPREIREQPSEEIMKLINVRLDHDDQASGLAIMHTAYLLGNSVYAKARLYRGKTPLCLLVGDRAVTALKSRISIKPLPLLRLTAKIREGIPFPVNLDQPDLVVFHKEKLSDFVQAFRLGQDCLSILPIDHVINLLLLPLHPVRGLEAQERLAQILQNQYEEGEDER